MYGAMTHYFVCDCALHVRFATSFIVNSSVSTHSGLSLCSAHRARWHATHFIHSVSLWITYYNHVCNAHPNPTYMYADTRYTQHTVLAHATISTMNIENACCDLLLLFSSYISLYDKCVIVCSLQKFETTHTHAECVYNVHLFTISGWIWIRREISWNNKKIIKC